MNESQSKWVNVKCSEENQIGEATVLGYCILQGRHYYRHSDRERNWGTERSSNVPKVTEHVSGGVWIWTQAVFFFLAAPLSLWSLVPQPGIEPGPPAVVAWSPNHWTARKFPFFFLFFFFFSGSPWLKTKSHLILLSMAVWRTDLLISLKSQSLEWNGPTCRDARWLSPPFFPTEAVGY